MCTVAEERPLQRPQDRAVHTIKYFMLIIVKLFFFLEADDTICFCSKQKLTLLVNTIYVYIWTYGVAVKTTLNQISAYIEFKEVMEHDNKRGMHMWKLYLNSQE